jgi:hypothetical protein
MLCRYRRVVNRANCRVCGEAFRRIPLRGHGAYRRWWAIRETLAARGGSGGLTPQGDCGGVFAC